GSESTRMGASMPASRSSTPSSTSATPSAAAPASIAARATGTAPWPYASAFTTAITAAGATRSRSTPTLCRIASRSISTRVGRNELSALAPCEMTDEIAARDHADGASVLDDHHVGDVGLVHQRRRVLEARVRRQPGKLLLHHLADGGGDGLAELLVVAGDLAGQREVHTEDRHRGRHVQPRLG